MRILSAEFLTSCVTLEQFPRERLPEVACAGRSNVGKSSLINSLVNRRGLAKVSKTPGKTQTVNVFELRTDDPGLKRLYLVDLPGYGYAKVPRAVKDQWGPMMERYLQAWPHRRVVLFLVDARGVQPVESESLGWLRSLASSVVVVATKLDKLTRSERASRLAALREALELPDAIPMIGCSSLTGEGIDKVRGAIQDVLKTGSNQALRR